MLKSRKMVHAEVFRLDNNIENFCSGRLHLEPRRKLTKHLRGRLCGETKIRDLLIYSNRKSCSAIPQNLSTFKACLLIFNPSNTKITSVRPPRSPKPN